MANLIKVNDSKQFDKIGKYEDLIHFESFRVKLRREKKSIISNQNNYDPDETNNQVLFDLNHRDEFINIQLVNLLE